MLGCIAVGWGLVASSMAAVTNTSTFLTVRFLLGIAEAGTVPGAESGTQSRNALVCASFGGLGWRVPPSKESTHL